MISIITPVLNEEKDIEAFLIHLGTVEGDFELILVDGHSTDATVEKAKNCRDGFSHRLTILESARGRAVQMNRGAQVAEGNILLFLHVDCMLEKDALPLIEEKIFKTNACGGGFIQAFSNPDLFLKFMSTFGNFRAGFTKVFFGDYGIFMKKEVFRKIGGYDDIPFLEDVELCRKAKRHCRLIQIDRNIVTSPRRYLKKGKVRLTVAFILATLFNTVRWRPGFLWKYLVDN
jgi:rSAM/selenodomain-associated transferase 2